VTKTATMVILGVAPVPPPELMGQLDALLDPSDAAAEHTEATVTSLLDDGQHCSASMAAFATGQPSCPENGSRACGQRRRYRPALRRPGWIGEPSPCARTRTFKAGLRAAGLVASRPRPAICRKRAWERECCRRRTSL
jgi:hypothetical protein